MVSTQGVQHHLRIMVTVYEHALAVLVVHDIKRTVCNDHAVAGTKAGWNKIAVIQPLLHHDQRMRTGLLDALHCGNDELRIDIRVRFHLLILIFRGWTLHPFMQIFPQLVLAQRMGSSSLLGVHRGFIWKVLLQPCRWRTVQPPLRAGSRKNCMYFRHDDLP